MTFHNPYHFVPIAPEPQVALAKDDLATGKTGHVTHDRYLSNAPKGANIPEVFSGRLLCRLTTVDPIFIGHTRDEESASSPQHVKPFELEDGKPSIPASSLRGLVSSIAEAASNSALRVLDNRLLSRRMDFASQENLPAIGMIVKGPDANGKPTLRLLPLTLPPMSWDPVNKEGQVGGTLSPYADIFRRMPTLLQSHVPLKVFVDGYDEEDASTGRQPMLRVRASSFLQRVNPDSYSADNSQAYWYIKPKGRCSWKDATTKSRVLATQPYLKEIQTKTGPRWFLLGQKVEGEGPISEEEYQKLGKPTGYIRGILRVLGIDDRIANMPMGKRHEIFIPFPEGIDQAPTYGIEEAIEKFHELADQRTEEDRQRSLPFEVKGSKRSDDPKKFEGKIRLRARDLVFFEAQGLAASATTPAGPGRSTGGFGSVRIVPREGAVVALSQNAAEVKITQIAISSIWRREAGGRVHDFFRKISPKSQEFLPFNPERTTVTLAEALFGFVEHRAPKDSVRASEALALASRLRFSFGYLGPAEQAPHYIPEVPLKALLSPKPPCPPFYFKLKSGKGAYIQKKNLNQDDHTPQGRKFYLHRYPGTGAQAEPWKTQMDEADGEKMRSVITPIKAGQQFFFHIDFENLSRQELGLVCYAIRPAPPFYHKLGMGKPIGLGKVRIDPIGIFFIDRQARYATKDFTLKAGRYHGIGLASGIPTRPADLETDRKEGQRTLAALQAFYPREVEEWEWLTASGQAWPTFDHLRENFRQQMDRGILGALEVLGDPSKVQNPVHTPQVQNREGGEMEDKSYEWFVVNDRGGRQYLKPLAETPEKLPTLERLPAP